MISALYIWIAYILACAVLGWWLAGHGGAWGMLAFVIAGAVALEVGFFASLLLEPK